MSPQNTTDYAALARQYGGVSGPVEDLMSMIRGHDAAHEVQTHKIISPETGLTTEESEHARQLKQARPLSTAIPHLPAWANTPILPTVEKYGEKIDRALGEGPWIDARKKALAEYDVQHPIQAGIAQGINQIFEGMTTPANLALMATIPESKIMSAFFALQAAQGAYKNAGAAKDAFLAGKNEDAARLATQAVLSGGMAGLAGTHAIAGTPLGDIIAEDARTLAKGGRPAEAGFVELPFGAKEGKEPIPTGAYKAFDESSPFYLKSEQIVPEKMKGPMPAQDVHKMLLSNGVKPEELKWVGLDKYLGDKGKEKVSPSEIIQHIKDNALQIQEVPHGEGPEVQQAHEQWFALGERGNKLVSEGKYDEAMKVFDQEREARLKYESLRNQSIPTKHGGWTMPGGENYRELLITAPKIGRDPVYEKLSDEVRRAEKESYDYMESHTQSLAHPDPEMQKMWERVAKAKEEFNEYQKKKDQEYGEFYRPRANDFVHPHWEEPNVLAHTRFNDRTGPNGEKLMHIEELQADWAAKGRKKGFGSSDEIKKLEDEAARTKEAFRKIDKEANKADDDLLEAELSGSPSDIEKLRDQARFYKGARSSAHHSMNQALRRLQSARAEIVPDRPFKQTGDWTSLLLKRILRYAADHGYDGVSWTPGEEQAERYDLSKHLDRIDYDPVGKDETALWVFDKSGNGIHDTIGERVEGTHWSSDRQAIVVPNNKLEDVVGKDLASRILSGQGEENEMGNMRLANLDLKVGGEGMKGFYNKIVPETANKILKPFGAKVEETKVEVPASWKEQKHVYKGPEPTEEDIDKLYKAAKSGGPDIFINPINGQKEQFAINRVSVEQPLREIRDLVSRGADIKEVLATHGNNEIAQLLGGDLEQVVKPKMKEVPYIQITPKMRDVLKKVPFTLFTILATALGLGSSGPQAKAEDKNNPAPKENFSDILAQAKLRHPSNPHRFTTPDGGIYAFPDAESLANFKQELGLE